MPTPISDIVSSFNIFGRTWPNFCLDDKNILPRMGGRTIFPFSALQSDARAVRMRTRRVRRLARRKEHGDAFSALAYKQSYQAGSP